MEYIFSHLIPGSGLGGGVNSLSAAGQASDNSNRLITKGKQMLLMQPSRPCAASPLDSLNHPCCNLKGTKIDKQFVNYLRSRRWKMPGFMDYLWISLLILR